MIRSLLVLALLAAPASADVGRALDDHVLPGLDWLAETTAALAETPCDQALLRPAYAQAALAWAAVSHLTLGPAEEEGRARAVLFWPDDRDATGRGLRLLREGGEAAWTPDAIARASVAARGLGALERQIGDGSAEPCGLTLALADDLAATTAAIRDGWTGGFADLMRDAGAAGNTRFLAPKEAEAALFTALLSGLEATAEQRLGGPLGTFDRPRSARAELHRSDLSLRMVRAALTSLRGFAATLADAPRTDAALARAIEQAGAIDDPALVGVADPISRIRIEALRTSVREARDVAAQEIGTALGVPAGFNSADGD